MFLPTRLVLLFVAALFLSLPLFCQSALAGSHCGAAGDWRSNLVPDRWPPQGLKLQSLPGGKRVKMVPVFKACIRHDRCYDRAGSSRAGCDRQFLSDIRAECDRVYRDVLDLLHRQACRSAAMGYYQAVAKYGGPAFAKAQAKHRGRAKRRARAMAAKTGQAGQAPQKPGARLAAKGKRAGPEHAAAPGQKPAQVAKGQAARRPSRPKWSPWGRLAGVSELAAMHGKLYAYKKQSGQLFVSPTAQCDWQLLGQAPAGQGFAGGQGYLYLAGVNGGELWTMRPRVRPWQKLGQAPGVLALAAGGNRLLSCDPRGVLRASHPRAVSWQEAGRVPGTLSLAIDAVKLYCLSNPGLKIVWRRKGKSDWQTLGSAPAEGSLAADKGVLFLALRQSGQILSAPAR